MSQGRGKVLIHRGYKCGFVSIRNVHLGMLIIVSGFRFFFFSPVLLCLIPRLMAKKGAEKQMVMKEIQETGYVMAKP